ncbi:MAG TPA: sigma-70 family RNA polymerase sigma factor [Gemmataceae bacterium]|nr:sigma-70 family RNA polymerase sigma factor [Gemmataceae bacterium]
MQDVADAFSNLMRKVRLGDHKALAQLLQHYEREVHQAACHLLGRSLRSSLDPADLVQSVHRTLLRGLRDNKFEVASREKLVALAVTVARNKVFRAARRLECEKRCNAALAETAAHECTRVGPESPADPARKAEYNDTLEKIYAQLNECDRRLVQMRLQGYSTAEAAREAGVSADVLRVRLSRLRQLLRERNLLTEWI